MQAAQCLCQPFIIPRQETEARRLGVTALHHPPLWQQHKALFRLGQLHDFEVHVVGLRIPGCLRPRIALVDKHQFDRIPGDRLHLGGQGADLAPTLFVGCGDMESQQMAPRLHRHMHLRAPTAFAPVIARPRATFGRRL
jgi:hypothetical protein